MYEVAIPRVKQHVTQAETFLVWFPYTVVPINGFPRTIRNAAGPMIWIIVNFRFDYEYENEYEF